MMGQRERGQGQFFYAFDLDKVVPADHLVRQIDGVLDLDWVHEELAPYYSHTGRPILFRQDDRHAIVKVAHCVIRVRREDGAALNFVPGCGVFPARP